MSFLDENKADTLRKLADLEDQKADLEKELGGDISMEEKLDPVGQEDDDIDNDGDVDSTDKYLANKRKAVAKAIMKSKKTIKKETLEEGILSKLLGGAAVLAGLFALGKINTSDSEIQALQAKYEQAQTEEEKEKIKDQITARLIFLDTGREQVKEDSKVSEGLGDALEGGIKDFISGRKMDFVSMAKGLEKIKKLKLTPEEEELYKDTINKIKEGKEPFKKDSKKEKNFFKLCVKAELDKKEIENIKEAIKAIRDNNTTNENMDKDKEEFSYKAPKDTDKDDIKIDPDTKFTVDLKHLIQKHMKEGKSKEDTIKFTKELMAKLHNKGEVTVDGTKIVFKEAKKKKSGYMGYTEMAEADIPMDKPMALPEPDAPDYLGDDGMDYEGGMAKSQMLKMKKYAVALCDMIEDESQLESWVQAKLTKASDYMSSVFHYLDYQRSKMNEEEEFKPLTKQEKDRLVDIGGLEKSELAAYEKFIKDNPDLPDSMPKSIKAFRAQK